MRSIKARYGVPVSYLLAEYGRSLANQLDRANRPCCARPSATVVAQQSLLSALARTRFGTLQPNVSEADVANASNEPENCGPA
jgi:hypothetical protein